MGWEGKQLGWNEPSPEEKIIPLAVEHLVPRVVEVCIKQAQVAFLKGVFINFMDDDSVLFAVDVDKVVFAFVQR